MFEMMGKPTFYLEPDAGVASAGDGTVAGEGNLSEGQDVGKTPTQQEPAKVETPAWMAQLPDDLKGNEELKQYTTLGKAIKGLMENNAVAKAEGEVVPEDIQYGEFAKTISADDDPFGDIQNSYVEMCKEMKLSQADAEKLIDKVNAINADAKGKMLEKGREVIEKTMHGLWGNDYDAKRALMAKGYQAINDTDGSLQAQLDANGVSLLPAVWEVFSRIGAMISEDTGTISTAGGDVLPEGCPIDYSKPSK